MTLLRAETNFFDGKPLYHCPWESSFLDPSDTPAAGNGELLGRSAKRQIEKIGQNSLAIHKSEADSHPLTRIRKTKPSGRCGPVSKRTPCRPDLLPGSSGLRAQAKAFPCCNA